MVHNYSQSSPLIFPSLSGTKENSSEVDLVRVGQWIVSLSSHDQVLLRHTREFKDFVDATCRLEKAQRNIQTWDGLNDTSEAKDLSIHSTRSFLQCTLSEEAVLGVLDFLESYSLVQIATTCTRLRDLAYRNARARCKEMERERQLTDVMCLLRAKEQIEGLDSGSNLFGLNVSPVSGTLPSVRIPTLLPGRRVLVTGAGDADFNGIYFCTGCNGNGFVFTKPRCPFQRISQRAWNLNKKEENIHGFRNLNCIFARRFSGQVWIFFLNYIM